jgi:hypothetical protein
VVGRGAQCLDVGRVQQLGEDVCVGCAGGLDDEVRGGAGRGGGFAQCQEGLESVEGLCLLHGGEGGEELR